MTLDALFQLMKIISPSETPSGGDLANFMTMLISTKNHSDALLPFFAARVYAFSCPIAIPKKQLRCFHPVSPKQATLSRCSTLSGWPDVRYATSGELQTPESGGLF